MKIFLVGFGVVAMFIIVYSFFLLPFNQIVCNSKIYTQYNDLEGPNLMYNTLENKKMFWKFTTFGKSIVYYEVENNITTILHMRENKDSNNYEKDIQFIATDNQISDQEIQNLKSCYPDKKMELETNIRKTKVGDQTYEIKGEMEVLK